MRLFTIGGFLGLVAASALTETRAEARPQQVKPNAREACRSAVAGAYLKVYDERERLKTYLKALDGQIAALTAALTAARAEQAKVEQEAAAKSFDVALAAHQDEIMGTIRTLEARSDEARALHRDAGTELDRHAAAEAGLRAAIERVFVFTRVEDKPDGGYPTDLRYRSPCPKYRHLCPLPSKDVEQLLKIEPGALPLPECQRYAGLSRLR